MSHFLITSDESEPENESDYYSAADTSNTPPPEGKSESEILRRENVKLKKEMRSIEERTTEKIKTQFNDLFTKQEEYFRKLLRENEAANENLKKRRLSLAVKCINEYPECSPFASSNNTTVVLNHRAKSSLVANSPKSVLTTLTSNVENQANKDSKTMDLMAAVRELEENAEVREAYIVKLQEDIRGMINEVSNSRKSVELMNTQNGRDWKVVSLLTEENMKDVTDEGHKMMNDDDMEVDKVETDPLNITRQSLTEGLSDYEENTQFEKLSEDERRHYEAKIQILENDLNDARELCHDCSTKLDEANSQSEHLSQEVNKLEADNLRLKEEEDFLNIMISDLKTQINELKSKLEGKRGRESMDSVAAKSLKRAKRVSISFSSKRSKKQIDDSPCTPIMPMPRGRTRKQKKTTVKEAQKEENPEDSFVVTSLDESGVEEEKLAPFAIRIPKRPKMGIVPTVPRPAKRRLPRRGPARPEYAEFDPVSISPLQNTRK